MKYLVLFSLLIAGNWAWSQSDTTGMESKPISPEIEVRATIDAMFSGMRTGDSSMVASVFHSDLRLMSTYTNKKGESKLHTGSRDEFVTAVGTPHDQIWDERISNVVIQVDANLAQAWMDYSFYLDGKLSHCGVNAFQFIKQNGKWKIISITDTRRKKGCI